MNKDFLLLGAAYLFFAIPLSIMDSRKFRISLPFLVFGSVVILCLKLGFLSAFSFITVKNLVFALLTSFLLFFCVRVFSGQGIGYSDIFFGMYTAIYTGFYLNIVSAIFAALLGVLYYLFLAVVQKIKKKQHIHRPIFAIPFVPFITAGAVLSMLLFYVIA